MNLYLSRQAARHILEIITSRFNQVCSLTEHVHVEQLMTVDEVLRIANQRELEIENEKLIGPQGAD